MPGCRLVGHLTYQETLAIRFPSHIRAQVQTNPDDASSPSLPLWNFAGKAQFAFPA